MSKYLTFDEIDFPATSRAYNATDVVALVSSIRAIGLLNPSPSLNATADIC